MKFVCSLIREYLENIRKQTELIESFLYGMEIGYKDELKKQFKVIKPLKKGGKR